MTKVRFDVRLKCFVANSAGKGTKLIRYQGVRTTLQKRFYSHYTYKSAQSNSAEPEAALHSRTTSSKLITRHAHNSSMGKRVGVKLDNGVKASIKRFKTHQFTVDYMCNHSTGYVKQFWLLMRRTKLTPVDAQVPVASSELRIATACDVVCYHNDSNHYQVLELKTGHQSYYFKCTTRGMSYPFRSQTDCVFNQNQLQLWLTNTLYKHTYPTQLVMPPMLVRMYPEGVDTYGLTSWVVQHAAEALKELAKIELKPASYKVSHKLQAGHRKNKAVRAAKSGG